MRSHLVLFASSIAFAGCAQVFGLSEPDMGEEAAAAGESGQSTGGTSGASGGHSAAGMTSAGTSALGGSGGVSHGGASSLGGGAGHAGASSAGGVGAGGAAGSSGQGSVGGNGGSDGAGGLGTAGASAGHAGATLGGGAGAAGSAGAVGGSGAGGEAMALGGAGAGGNLGGNGGDASTGGVPSAGASGASAGASGLGGGGGALGGVAGAATGGLGGGDLGGSAGEGGGGGDEGGGAAGEAGGTAAAGATAGSSAAGSSGQTGGAGMSAGSSGAAGVAGSVAVPTCGDGIKNGSEECDGSDVGTGDCASTVGKPATGTLGCTSQCKLDLSACAWCGDQIINGSEECDGTAAVTVTCPSLVGLGSTGTPGCTSACIHDAGPCTSATQTSCVGLAANCGTAANASCCSSSVVPAGTFHLGRATGDNDFAPNGYTVSADEVPSVTATVSSFRLDTYEVTVGRFRQFVTAVVGGWRPDAGSGTHSNIPGGLDGDTGWDPTWDSNLWPAQSTWNDSSHLACGSGKTWTSSAGTSETLPINCVSWYESDAFCIWDGGFLPTEIEWEYAAAGGSEERIFPWSPPGDETLNATFAVFQASGAAPVGSKSPAGDARWGQSDMAGNVNEWTGGIYNYYPGGSCTDCSFLTGSSYHPHRGDSFLGVGNTIRVAKRFFQASTYREYNIGIRCARK